MAYHVELSERAQRDIVAAYEYIAAEATQAAIDFRYGLQERINSLPGGYRVSGGKRLSDREKARLAEMPGDGVGTVSRNRGKEVTAVGQFGNFIDDTHLNGDNTIPL